jgi:hypothetical protein
LFSASAWSVGLVFVIPFTFNGETPMFSLFGFFMNEQSFYSRRNIKIIKESKSNQSNQSRQDFTPLSKRST